MCVSAVPTRPSNRQGGGDQRLLRYGFLNFLYSGLLF
jgi:hypothetical protein